MTVRVQPAAASIRPIAPRGTTTTRRASERIRHPRVDEVSRIVLTAGKRAGVGNKYPVADRQAQIGSESPIEVDINLAAQKALAADRRAADGSIGDGLAEQIAVHSH